MPSEPIQGDWSVSSNNPNRQPSGQSSTPQGLKPQTKLFFIVAVVAIVLVVGAVLFLRSLQVGVLLPIENPISGKGSISITTPKGTEQWSVGTTHTITWESTGVEKVRISSAVGGKDLGTSQAVDASLGRYEVAVPDVSGFGKEPPFEVTIYMHDDQNPAISDRATFTAVAPLDTSDWQTYQNDEYGFEVKYPQDWITEIAGPNFVQEALEKGETVSGTVAPTLKTISFFSPAWQSHPRLQFTVTVSETSRDIAIENYDSLSYSSGCDSRWLNERPKNISIITSNEGIKFLEVKIAESEQYFSCYYFKNRSNNKIVLQTALWGSKLDFEYAEKQIQQILSTFRFVEPSATTPQCEGDSYFGCRPVTSGVPPDPHEPFVCGCIPQCVNPEYVFVSKGTGFWPDGSQKGNFTCTSSPPPP